MDNRIEEERENYFAKIDLANDFANTFRTPEGQRTLEAIMIKCGINNSPFTGNSKTFYAEGMQDIGRFIKHMIMESDPAVFQDVERNSWIKETVKYEKSIGVRE